MSLLYIALGAAAAVLFTMAARKMPGKSEHWAYAIGLMIAAGLYVLFAYQSDSVRWFRIELATFVPFAVMGIVGAVRRPSVLALAWLLHALWDILVVVLASTQHAPEWYPPSCVGFDLVIAFLVTFRLWITPTPVIRT